MPSARITVCEETSGSAEACSPFTPNDLVILGKKFQLDIVVEPSLQRTYTNAEFIKTGISVAQAKGHADLFFGVNTLSPDRIEAQKWYFLSSFGTQGFARYPAMLKRMAELGCSLVDVERIVDRRGQQLVSWGRYAGQAGMVEALRTYGHKMAASGFENVLTELNHPWQYESLSSMVQELERIGDQLSEQGFPVEMSPLIIALIGSTASCHGADEILSHFPNKTFSAQVINENIETFSGDRFSLYKVMFSQEELFADGEKRFNHDDFMAHPQRYKSVFDQYLSFLPILVNGSFWSEDHSKLLTREFLRNESYIRSNPFPKVVVDLDPRMDGPLDIIHRYGDQKQPCYTYIGKGDLYQDGIVSQGTTVVAIPSLFGLFAREASQHFSGNMSELLAGLLPTWPAGMDDPNHIPDLIKPALVLYKGRPCEARG